MDFVTLSGTTLQASRVGLGTWAMGGWMWGAPTSGSRSGRALDAGPAGRHRACH